MLDRLIADLIVTFHFLFIAFAVGGGLLVLWRPKLKWIHLPAVAWAVLVEVMSWPCPLTRWENLFRDRYGAGGYDGAFIDRYLIPIIYPAGLTPRIQLFIGIFVFTVNTVIYGILVRRWVRRRNAMSDALLPAAPPA